MNLLKTAAVALTAGQAVEAAVAGIRAEQGSGKTNSSGPDHLNAREPNNAPRAQNANLPVSQNATSGADTTQLAVIPGLTQIPVTHLPFTPPAAGTTFVTLTVTPGQATNGTAAASTPAHSATEHRASELSGTFEAAIPGVTAFPVTLPFPHDVTSTETITVTPTSSHSSASTGETSPAHDTSSTHGASTSSEPHPSTSSSASSSTTPTSISPSPSHNATAAGSPAESRVETAAVLEGLVSAFVGMPAGAVAGYMAASRWAKPHTKAGMRIGGTLGLAASAVGIGLGVLKPAVEAERNAKDEGAGAA